MVLMLFNDNNYVHVLVCSTVIRAPERHGGENVSWTDYLATHELTDKPDEEVN
jgi:hypothetical protein